MAALVDVEMSERLHNLDEEFSGQSEEVIKAGVDEVVKTARTRLTNA